MTKKKLHMALLAAVLLSVVFAAAVFGTGREAPLPGLPVSSAGGTLSLLAESGHGPYIAYSQNGAGQLCLLDPATSDMSTLTVNSPILSAACREGNLVVVTEEYGLLCTIAFSPSLEPEPSIAPSPSLEPSPIGPDWLDAYRKHGYYYITGTIPIKSLIEVSKPDSILLHTADGQLIEEGSGLESGPLCTGMTVIQDDEIIARIVVCGDCDGNGRLTSADMHEAQMFLLQGAEDADECRFLAADHDDDGEITTKDLLWLSSQLESP